MKLAIAAAALILTACANVRTVQADCERISPSFVALAQCLQTNIERDPILSQRSDAKLYHLRAKQLAEDVMVGRITDTEARVALQREYVQIQRASNASGAALANVIGGSPVTRTTCTPADGLISCVTR